MPLLRADDLDLLADADIAAADRRERWLAEARPKQVPPGDNDWDTAVWVAGRFFGKTRTLVEHAWWEGWRLPLRIHALAPTLGDIRRTMFEGESGFLQRMPPEIVKSYNKSDKEIRLTNGTLISGFSVIEEADRLRGPQCHLLIFDEAAAGDRPAGNLEAAYKVAALGCRLPYPDGTPSRKLIATTPRPIPFLKRLIKRPGVRVIRGISHENLQNVAPSIRGELLALEGTAYGRQEIYGEFLDDEDTGIFKRAWIKLWPATKPLPEFAFIVECYDTAFTPHDFSIKTQKSDPTACTVWGVFNVPQVFSREERKKLGLSTSMIERDEAGVTRGSRYAVLLLDAWEDRIAFSDLIERARVQHRIKWGKPGRRADVVLIEEKASGGPLRSVLMDYGVPTWPYRPNVSKTIRAHAVSPIVKQGMVFVPESARPERKGLPRDWAEPFLEQVCAFAGEGSTEHDDFVDTFSCTLLYLRDRDMLRAEPAKRFVDEDEKSEYEERQAQKISDREKRVVNPYG